MGFIYCITNIVNQKQYVGKTLNSVEQRWSEHLNDYKRPRCEKRALYDAFIKYGIENFRCETLCECLDSELEEKEIYYIELYNTFHNGYNLTKGGDGKQLYDYDAIIDYYLNNEVTIVETAKHFNCHEDTISSILKKMNIKTRIFPHKGVCGNCKKPKKISCFDLNGSIVSSFETVSEAGKWLFENKKCKTYNSGVRGHISSAANGKQPTAYGYIWKYNL